MTDITYYERLAVSGDLTFNELVGLIKQGKLPAVSGNGIHIIPDYDSAVTYDPYVWHSTEVFDR